MRIILTSSPEMDQAVFQEVASLLDGKSEISIGFIMSSAEYADNPEALESKINERSNNLISLGFKQADGYYLPHHNADDLLKRLRNYDVLYLRGCSNTFHLLNVVRQVGFEKVLEQLKDKKVMVGESAGGYILCPNIVMARWKDSRKNEEGLTDLSGLNYVPFLVTAHYSDKVYNLVKEGAKKAGIKTYALKDGDAIVVNGESISFIGSPAVFNEF